MDLDVAVANTSDGTAQKLLKAVEEFHTYIERNRTFIPNYASACSKRSGNWRGVGLSGVIMPIVSPFFRRGGLRVVGLIVTPLASKARYFDVTVSTLPLRARSRAQCMQKSTDG